MKVKSTTKRVCSECGFKTMLTLVDDKMSIISSKNIASSVFDWSELPHHIYTENLPHFYTTGVLDFYLGLPLRFHQQPLGGLVQGALASAATETLAASCNFLIGRNFLKDPHATGTLPVVCLVRYGYPPLKVLDLFFRWWLFWRIFWHDRDSPWKNTELEEYLLFFPTTERANLRSWTWFTWKIRVGRLLLPFGKGSCSGAVQTTC